MVENTIHPIALEATDQLSVWQQALASKEGDAPSAWDVNRLQQRLELLASVSPEQARPLQDSLMKFRNNLVTRRRNEIAEQLSRLSDAVGDDGYWPDLEKKCENLLSELEALEGSEETELRSSLRKQRLRLQGEALLAKAREDWQKTTARIAEDEEKNDFLGIVQNAQDLKEWIGKLYREMQAIQEALENEKEIELESELRQLKEKAEQYYDLKRRLYEGAITADLDKDYEKALIELEAIRKDFGDDYEIYYYPEDWRETSKLTRIPVSQAIANAKKRRQDFLINKAAPHIEAIKHYLENGDPGRAQDEYENIEGKEHLEEGAKYQLNELKENIDGELEAKNTFEQEVTRIADMPNKLQAWKMLDELGRKYRRFISTSQIWRETRYRTVRAIEQSAFHELTKCAQLIVKNESEYARDICEQIQHAYQDWSADFKAIMDTVHQLQTLMGILEHDLKLAREYLETKHLEDAEKTLKDMKHRIQECASQISHEEVAQPLLQLTQKLGDGEPYNEVQRAWDILDAYKNAGDLYGRLQQQVENTESVMELQSFAEEIEAHLARVPGRYREDFEALLALSWARYHYFLGKRILAVAGNPEDAKAHLQKAAQHEAFRLKAQEEINDIEDKLIPANLRVKAALEKIEQFVRYRCYWDAWQKAVEVSNEPAEAELRQTLNELRQRVFDKALETSKSVLEKALESRHGDPKGLRKHIKRMQMLDSIYLETRVDALWLIIHQAEASQAIDKKQWPRALESLNAALQRLENMTKSSDLQVLQRDLKQKKRAVRKELALKIASGWNPKNAIERLEQERRSFREDPDVLLAFVRIILKNAQRKEAEFEENLDDDFSKETDFLHKLRHDLLTARDVLDTAARQADSWEFDFLPAYEQTRLAILNQEPSEWANRRKKEIQRNEQHVATALTVNSKKKDIIHLLSTID